MQLNAIKTEKMQPNDTLREVTYVQGAFCLVNNTRAEWTAPNIDELVQERRNSIANALESTSFLH